MSRDREGKRGIIEFLATKTSLPSDALSGGLRLEIRGRNILFLGGCRRISEYSPSLIRLECKGCSVSVEGERLCCSSYHGGTVEIDGLICSVKYENGEEKT